MRKCDLIWALKEELDLIFRVFLLLLLLFVFFLFFSHGFKQGAIKDIFLKASLNSRFPSRLSTKVFLLLMSFHLVLIRIPKSIWTQPPPPHKTHWSKKEHLLSSSSMSLGQAIFQICIYGPEVEWAYKFWPQQRTPSASALCTLLLSSALLAGGHIFLMMSVRFINNTDPSGQEIRCVSAEERLGLTGR